jgi:hypothetical protein
MKRRNILTSICVGFTSLLTTGLYQRKKSVQKSLIIPQSVIDEIYEIVAKGGKITGYTYSMPPDKSRIGIFESASRGQRYFVKDTEKNWQIT